MEPRNRVLGYEQFSQQFQIDRSQDSGTAVVSLFKRGETRVELDEKKSQLRSGLVGFRVFSCFVPEEAMTEYLRCLATGTGVATCKLAEKFFPKNGSKKIDELIEHVVVYLLSLCGLNPILLSNPQYDVLDGCMNAGSADILASKEDKSPLLVSCTMAMPDSRKRNMLFAGRDAIAKRINVAPDTIRLALITGKPSVSPSGTDLTELAANDLESIWSMIRSGKIDEARKLLGG